jgi:hypothetical protein
MTPAIVTAVLSARQPCPVPLTGPPPLPLPGHTLPPSWGFWCPGPGSDSALHSLGAGAPKGVVIAALLIIAISVIRGRPVVATVAAVFAFVVWAGWWLLLLIPAAAALVVAALLLRRHQRRHRGWWERRLTTRSKPSARSADA